MSRSRRSTATTARNSRKARSTNMQGLSKPATPPIHKRFIDTLEPFKRGDDWMSFALKLEKYFSTNSISHWRQVPVLLASVTLDVYQILKNLCKPDLPKDKTYDDLMTLISTQFEPKPSVYRQRILFDSLKQGAESVNDWHTRIVYTATQCGFGMTLEARISDKFIVGMRPGPILDKLCEEELSMPLKHLIEVAMKQEVKVNGVVKKLHPVNLTATKRVLSRRKKVSDQKFCCCYTEALETSGRQNYTFYPNNNTRYVTINVLAPSDVYVALAATSSQTDDSIYEIVLGGYHNQKSMIRKNRTKPDKVEVPTPDILNEEEGRTFWICWNNNTISAGYRHNREPFMSWTDDEHLPIRYVGFRTGCGVKGTWLIHQGASPLGDCSVLEDPNGPTDFDGTNNWVSSQDGNIPAHAFIGGIDRNSRLYVVRCRFNGSIIPGKFHADYKSAYVPWNGSEIEFGYYEMLCNCAGRWVTCIEGNIPPNAIVGGHTEDGEPLYIGRAYHDGTLAVGKVQQSHCCCYIPYSGLEYSYVKYEILVS